jgi:hypothetical protein
MAHLGIAQCILILALVNGHEWSAMCPDCFTPEERVPGTYMTGGLVGFRATLITGLKRIGPFPASAGNQTLVIQPVA